MRDPIERQDVFDLLNSVSPYIGSWLIQYIDDAISSIPSAQPVEKDINVPCKDTISRQDAIDALDNIKIPRNASWYPYYQQALTAMSRLPSAQPEPQWIPCSERLPEESGRYLVSVLDGVGRRTTVAQYQPRYKAWTMTGRMAYWKVVAWMPLPEPYREEGEK